jgi:hypothetical protein
MQSIAVKMYLEPFKAAAGEGAVVELKLRLLAGKIPALQSYTYQTKLENIEHELVKPFADSLSAEEKKTLRLCCQLRNKVLHTEFRAARNKLKELGTEAPSGGVKELDIHGLSAAEVSEKIRAVKEGAKATFVADTSSKYLSGLYGWFLEAGGAGDFQKASDAFKKASAIVDRLASIRNT